MKNLFFVLALILSTSTSFAAFTPSNDSCVSMLKNHFPHGKHDSVIVTSTTVHEMIEEYLLNKTGSEEIVKKYTFADNASQLPTNELVAGTFQAGAAINIVFATVQKHGGSRLNARHARAVMTTLVTNGGAILAYDGAGPYPVIVVIDSVLKKVSGIELAP